MSAPTDFARAARTVRHCKALLAHPVDVDNLEAVAKLCEREAMLEQHRKSGERAPNHIVDAALSYAADVDDEAFMGSAHATMSVLRDEVLWLRKTWPLVEELLAEILDPHQGELASDYAIRLAADRVRKAVRP